MPHQCIGFTSIFVFYIRANDRFCLTPILVSCLLIMSVCVMIVVHVGWMCSLFVILDFGVVVLNCVVCVVSVGCLYVFMLFCIFY